LEIRQLNKSDEISLINLINEIENSLIDKTWWLPIKKEARENFFNKEWTIFYGAFENSKLIGASALFLNEYEYGETVSYLNIDKKSVGEVGRCMVHPDYRGKNLLFIINSRIIEEAKEKKLNYLVATAHPENIASNKSLKKTGFKIMKTIVKEKIYPRNILLLEINN